MVMADLMAKMTNDFEEIFKSYRGELVVNGTMGKISHDIIHKLSMYECEKDIDSYEVRVITDRDLVISFNTSGIDIGFIYLHYITKSDNPDLRFNIDIYSLPHGESNG